MNKNLKTLDDGQLIALVRAKATRIPFRIREQSRLLLKERGYRFIGTRIEKDDE